MLNDAQIEERAAMNDDRHRHHLHPQLPAPADGDDGRCDDVHAHPSKIARLRRRLLEPDASATLADIFKVLGDVTRVRILDALAQAELCVCDLAALVGLSESAVSHQLRLLRSMRVVRSRRAGRMVFYTLDDEHIIALFEQGLRHVVETMQAPPARSSTRPAVRIPGPRGRGRQVQEGAAK